MQLQHRRPKSPTPTPGPLSHLGPDRTKSRSPLAGLPHADAHDALRPGPAPKHGPRPAELDTLQGMLAAVKQAAHKITFASKTISARDLAGLVLATRTLGIYATAIDTKKWGAHWTTIALQLLRQAQSHLDVEEELKLSYAGRRQPKSVVRQTRKLKLEDERLSMAIGVLTCNAGFQAEVGTKPDA